MKQKSQQFCNSLKIKSPSETVVQRLARKKVGIRGHSQPCFSVTWALVLGPHVLVRVF